MRRSRELHQIGGQAVPEGVVIRSPRWWAVAVRRPDGGIHVESHPAAGFLARHPVLAKTPLRGALALADAMSVGLRALGIAARHSSPDGGGADESGSGEIAQGAAIAFGFFVLLFLVVPVVLVRGQEPELVRNLVEGGARIAIFLGYVLVISRLSGIGRMFAYHGAEHKVIAAFEAGDGRPTVEEARACSTIHVRCGTNFLTLLMIVSVLVFLPVLRDPWWGRLLIQIGLLPVVAGLAFELQRLAARAPRNLLLRPITWPGRLLQRITTREPDDDQLEVALAAFGELQLREAD